MKTLNDYSAILRGFPLPANQTTNQTAYSAVAPLSSQLLGAGAGLTGIAGMAGLFGASGGQVKKLQQGGLASRYAPTNRVSMGKTNYADLERPNFLERLRNQFNYLGERIEPYIDSSGAPAFELEFDDTLKKEQERNTELMEAMAKATEQNIKDQSMLENLYDLDDKEYTQAKEAYDKVIEDAKKERETEEEARAKRIRIAKYAPLMKKASEIAKAETVGDAVLLGIEGAGDVMLGEAAGEAAEITRAAALRAAAVEEAVQLAGINKDLSRDQIRIALMEAANKVEIMNPEQAKKYREAAVTLGESSLDLTGNIQQLIANKRLSDILSGAGEAPTFEEALAVQTQKEGGAVKLAKGGTPERSFDFVPKDGKLIAVPK